MADSSSSSDEEEKDKLKSAAWPTYSYGNNQKGTNSSNGTEQKKSLRNQNDFEERGDYRNVDATPEVKAFIAKKLTSWLDSSVSVVDGQKSRSLTSMAAVDNPDDDFHLFSTSKSGLTMKDNQVVKRKQRPPSSSGDSDSDGEKAKLSSVAVSYDQILQSSGSCPPDSQDRQVTSNLSPTNPHSPPTPAKSSQSFLSNAPPCDSELERRKRLAKEIGGETEAQDCCRGERKKKKKKRRKKRKTETICISQAAELSSESVLQKVIENDQSEEKILGTQPNEFEDETQLTSERSEQKAPKKKSRKKKRAKKHDR